MALRIRWRLANIASSTIDIVVLLFGRKNVVFLMVMDFSTIMC
jgi:hypothetical protein